MSTTERTRVFGREFFSHLLAIAAMLGIGVAVVAPQAPARNIAPQSRVTLSSNCGVEPRWYPGPLLPQLLVDQKRHRFYDACTKAEKNAWVRLEFQDVRRLVGIQVHGRGDCCWERAGLPLVAEISVDGAVFEAVARRDVPFTREDPWEVSFGARPAKAVRLRTESAGVGDLVLSEVELFEAAQ